MRLDNDEEPVDKGGWMSDKTQQVLSRDKDK